MKLALYCVALVTVAALRTSEANSTPTSATSPAAGGSSQSLSGSSVTAAAAGGSTSGTGAANSQSSTGTAPSQVASKRGDSVGEFTSSTSQQRPVYSPSLSTNHLATAASSGDYQPAASNSNLYYYYYPANQQHGGQTTSTSKGDILASTADPYQTSAASSYPSYSSDGPLQALHHSAGGYDGATGDSSHHQQHTSGGGYPSSAAAAYHLQQAYAAAAHHAYGGAPSTLVNPQLSGQYVAPVNSYQAGYSQTGGPYAAASSFQPTYSVPAGSAPGPPASDAKSRFYGLGSVIVPLVGLGALAFLLPSVTNLTGGKKKTKRSAELDQPSRANGIADYAERLEKYFKIYRAAVESEDCMNRIVCEIGDSMSSVRGKAALLALFEKVAPQWIVGKMGVFKYGALNEKAAKCARYKC